MCQQVSFERWERGVAIGAEVVVYQSAPVAQYSAKLTGHSWHTSATALDTLAPAPVLGTRQVCMPKEP